MENNSNSTIIDDNGTGVEYAPPEKITKPLNPSLIRVESKTMLIDALLKRICQHKLELTPGIRRTAGLWTDEAKSQLIESILLRIPLPAFYMDATNDKKWLVVDGLQRLTAIKRFMIDKDFMLRGLEFFQQLEGQSYNEMRGNLLRRIETTRVIVYLIDEGTPHEVKFNIFKRINTGGLPLSPQEIRHALYQGKATTFLENLAGSKEFKQATANSIRDERMIDREFVLRFIANRATTRDCPYKHNILNETMAGLNEKTDSELEELGERFKRAMLAAYQIFGNDAFRKRYNVQHSRYPINKVLFEVFSINLDLLSDEKIQMLITKREQLKTDLMKLMNQDSFLESSVSGDIRQVKFIFSQIENLFKELLA